MGDEMDINRTGSPDRPPAHPRPQQRGDPAATARPQHDLCDVLRPCEAQQGFGDTVCGHLVKCAAQRLQERPLLSQGRRTVLGESLVGDHVERQQLATWRPGADPGSTADQCPALLTSGETDQDPLPGLPGSGDAVLGPVALKSFLHPVGEPEQRQLAQRCQVPDPEVVGQRRFDTVRRIDVTVSHPAAQHLGREVDQLDPVGVAGHLVGKGLPLPYAGDLLDHVIEGLQVLHIERGDHIDAGGEHLLHVLPPLRVPRQRNVGVSQLVHQCDSGSTREQRLHIHVGEHRSTMHHPAARQRLQTRGHLHRQPPTVRLHQADHHIGPLGTQPLPLGQHRVRLPHTRRSPEIHLQTTTRHRRTPTDSL